MKYEYCERCCNWVDGECRLDYEPGIEEGMCEDFGVTCKECNEEICEKYHECCESLRFAREDEGLICPKYPDDSCMDCIGNPKYVRKL